MAYEVTPDQKENPDWATNGYGNEVWHDQMYGENAYDKSVDAYRERGAKTQEAIQLDQGRADESRGLEMNALGMLRAQGNGTAASSAAILAPRVTENAVQQAGQQVTAARGGIGAHIAAQRQASQAAGQQMLAGNAQSANARAQEISTGQNAYTSGAGAVQGQDIGAATTNASLAARQRALDEQHQQANERLAYDTRRTQESARKESARQDQQERERQRANAAARTAADFQKVKDVVGAVASSGASLSSASSGEANVDHENKRASTGSDERMKQDVHPMQMGSLSHLYRMRGR